MVTDTQVVAHLHKIISGSDLETTTATSVCRRLEADLGVDLSQRRMFIVAEIDRFLHGHDAVNEFVFEQEKGLDEEQRLGDEVVRNDTVQGGLEEGCGEKEAKEKKRTTKKKRNMSVSSGTDREDGHDSDGHRGATVMSSVAKLRRREETLDVEFDASGHALGKNGARFRSYLGVLARSKVDILADDWRQIPTHVKDLIWEEITLVFTGVEGRKKKELKRAGKMWRDFKTKLTTTYVTCKKHPRDPTPCAKYPFITDEKWAQFVSKRRTADFLSNSELQRRRQSQNLYPHTMSRRGYALVDEVLQKEMQESSGDSKRSSSIPRHVKWKRGRQDKKINTYRNNSIAEVAKRIDELEEQSSQGRLMPSGRRDILTVALGTDERPGRVRGVGGEVGFKETFSVADGNYRRRRSFEDEARFEERVAEEVKRVLADQVERVLAEMGIVPRPATASFDTPVNTSPPIV